MGKGGGSIAHVDMGLHDGGIDRDPVVGSGAAFHLFQKGQQTFGPVLARPGAARSVHLPICARLSVSSACKAVDHPSRA